MKSLPYAGSQQGERELEEAGQCRQWGALGEEGVAQTPRDCHALYVHTSSPFYAAKHTDCNSVEVSKCILKNGGLTISRVF